MRLPNTRSELTYYPLPQYLEHRPRHDCPDGSTYRHLCGRMVIQLHPSPADERYDRAQDQQTRAEYEHQDDNRARDSGHVDRHLPEELHQRGDDEPRRRGNRASDELGWSSKSLRS